MTPLGPDEVHVWTDRTDGPNRTDLLNDEELERAQRFKVEPPRRQFVAARSTLRRLLGEYLNSDPRTLKFITSEHGKPSLAEGGLEFNVSHTEGQVALAFAHSPVGIDVERFDRDLDHDSLTKRFFSEHERQQLSDMDAEERKAAFFRCWTQKEAYLKALGSGLSRDTRSFAVNCRAGVGGLVADDDNTLAPQRWRLQHVIGEDEFSVSLAVTSSIRKVRCFKAAES
ncbi:MAG: 4'-phosphopantetheinyl transferase family protein [Limisphaerales bacterium]